MKGFDLLNKTLVIMAAGMGSRYGGLKQVDPVGPDGSVIIDYSIYDAVKAGFNKVVFIIKAENEQIFREVIGDKVSKFVKVEYVFQRNDDLPEGFTAPEERIKPWGTGHAIYACRGVVNEPFMVINADDFYGRGCFETAAKWLEETENLNGVPKYSMVSFLLKNTLTENGTVSRGICDISADGKLLDVVERTRIIRRDGVISYTEDKGETWKTLPEESYASMNCWCFPASFIGELGAYFKNFLENEMPLNPVKGEFYLPFAVREMLKQGKCTVDVLKTDEKWFGVTYAEDKPFVVKSVKEYVDAGIYPEKLW